jgi:hypothetical protein
MPLIQEFYGNYEVPSSFIVPNTESWPKNSRNLKLGYLMKEVATGKLYNNDYYKDILIAEGISIISRSQFELDIIIAALHVHNQLFGDMNVPEYYIVPSDEPWPVKAWGMELGLKLKSILKSKTSNTEPLRRELRGLGVQINKV